jgi:hypothetical protein
MATSDVVIKKIFDGFTEMLRKRIEMDSSFLDLSQEALLSFFLAYTIIGIKPELFNHLYIEYPINTRTGSRSKIDLFVATDPEYYFEIKYIRPIPSRATRPLPQHRGKLINDLGKLIELATPESRRFLLLVADDKFVEHLVKKPGFPLKGSWKGGIQEMVTCETERREIKFGTQDSELNVTNRFRANKDGLHILLFEVS